ncbi:MAG: protein BatD [Bacteroidia bacterium]|nr:protein BatD [Bacteroidia bacterium]
MAQKISATVNRNALGIGEQFQLTYTIEGNARNFTPPSFADFTLLGGPYQSNQTSWVNGVITQSTSLTYLLQTKKEGKLVLAQASVDIGGKLYNSNTVTITVSKGQQQTQSNQSNEGLSTKNVFLRATADKNQAYRGEAITVTYKLYFNVNVYNYSLDKAPSFNGFFNQDIKLPEQPDVTNEVINGVQFKVATIKKVVLFPQQTGLLNIDEMKGQCVARIQVKKQRSYNDPFDIFNDPFFTGGAQDQSINIKSDPVRITVKDFPTTPPASFKGAVGVFDFTATLDKTDVKENEPINLKVRISGKGNLKLLENPEVKLPPQLETYDPKIAEKITVADGGSSGSKAFDYLIIPRTAGNYEIPPIEFTYFDLNRKAFVTHTSGKLLAKVAKGDGSVTATVYDNSVNKTEVAVLGKDIRYIKQDATFTSNHNSFYGSTLFYASVAMPILLLIIGGIYIQKQQALNNNFALVKSKGANKLAVKRLATANKYLAAKQNHAVYDEVYKALTLYLSDKLNIPMADLNKDHAATMMSLRKVSEATIKQWVTSLSACEMARFAPSAVASPQQIYNDAIGIITKIENEIV